MGESQQNQEKLLDLLTKEFVDKISHTNAPNLGVFNALKMICQRASLWELSILLVIAEKEPIKIETIISELDSNISKSTLYRKIAAYVDDQLVIKDADSYLRLHSDLKSLGIIAKLRKNMQNL